MRSAFRSVVPALGSLVLAIALTGCAAQRAWLSDRASAPPTSSQTSSDRKPSTRVSAQGSGRLVAKGGPAPVNGFKPVETLKDVRFGSGRVDVLWADSPMLETVCTWLKENPNRLVLLEGHSDDLGTREQKVAMGQRRARSVLNYLVTRGVDASRITIMSSGSDHPVCIEKTVACRAKNRRVSFLVKEREGR